MISSLRRSLDSWVVRGLFLVLLLAFMVWGIGDVVRNMRGDQGDWAARVGDQTIEPEELTRVYRRELANVSRMLGGRIEPTPEIKRSVVMQALQALVQQAVLTQQEQALRLAVPEDAMREAILQIPRFRGADGRYSADVAREVLRQNGLTDASFAALIRVEALNRQLLEAVRAGTNAPPSLARAVYAFQNEKRSADVVEVPFASQTAPDPTDADLHRWYDNHPDLYTTAEFRHIKAIVLSPETIARGLTVSDDAIAKYYETHRPEFARAATRSIELLSAPDEAKAQALAAKWRAGADWAAMQAAAKDAGGSAIDLPDTARDAIPAPELAQAIFAAPVGPVADVEHDALGWHVFHVVNETPGTARTLAEAHDEIRDKLVAEQAAAELYDRVNDIQKIFDKGDGVEKVYADLGALALAGTLDAQGNDAGGHPVPIPGGDAVRTAIANAVFAAHVGDPPHLVEVPPATPGAASTWYAFELDSIVPAGVRPYDIVADQVREDWTKDAKRHAANEAATKVLTAIKGGQSFADAATVAGLTVRRTALTGRAAPAEGIPRELMEPLFSLKPGEPTMVETPEAFIVAVPAEIVDPDPAADPSGFKSMTEQLEGAVANDIEASYEAALRNRNRVTVNNDVIADIAR
jgi:peptidyl-prolyl cis-trans isomerase D